MEERQPITSLILADAALADAGDLARSDERRHLRHTRAAQRAGASAEELMEAVWVAAEMRAGAAYAHAAIMLAALPDKADA
jgi:alkylhydroperoxidase/carboxymuconolactone decarboxylase family protein YurZ